MSEREKQAYIETEREIEAELAALRRAEKLEAEKAAKYALFGRHIELLEKIEMLVDRLPQDIADQVVEIGFSASKIIKAMERDPRCLSGRPLLKSLSSADSGESAEISYRDGICLTR